MNIPVPILHNVIKLLITKPIMRIAHFFSLIIMLIGVNACSIKSDTTVLKLAHSLDTKHPVHLAIEYMAKRVEFHSAGKVRIDIYPAGQLGSERELMELLQIGSLAMTKVSSSPMEGFVPEMKIFNIPYVFRDSEHFWQVLNGDIGRDLLLAGEAVRLRGLGYFDAGSRSFYTTDRPIYNPSDLDGLKIRVQQSQTSIQMVRALGGSATPISWGELYTALQQGVVDGAENNPPSFYSSKHFEVAKYYTLDEHTMVPDILLISRYIWGQLSSDEQRWLQLSVDEAVVYQRQLWATATADALAAVEKAGVEIIRPDKTIFEAQVETMYESLKDTPAYEVMQKIRQLPPAATITVQ